MKRYIISLVIILGYQLAFGQQITKSTYNKTLLKNATVHTITDGTKENTDVLIDQGKIVEIGESINASDAIVIDCSDHHVYPGFINSGTQLGMSEVGAVSLTNDFNEIGDFIPHMQALTAVNPNAVAIPVTRVNGVTSVIAAPRGGLFPGTASLINLHGYTPNDMFAGFKGVAMNFPSTAKRGRRDSRSDEDIKKAQEKAIKNLNEIWANLSTFAKIDSAKGAQNTSTPKTYQPEYDALIDVYRGNTTLMIEVNKDEDIKNAIEWVKDKNLKVIFTGVTEGWRVAKELAESGIPVITGPVLSIPGRSYTRYDVNYSNAGVMQQAGVTVALRTNDAENAVWV